MSSSPKKGLEESLLKEKEELGSRKNGNGERGFDMSRISLKSRYKFLKFVEKIGGVVARNKVSKSCEPLLFVNRHFMVKKLRIVGPLKTSTFHTVFESFSSLVILIIEDATMMPRDFVQRLLRRPLDTLGNIEPKKKDAIESGWKQIEETLNRPVLEFKKDCPELSPYINPIHSLKVAHSDHLTNSDLNQVKHFVFLEALTLNNINKLTSFSFLYNLAFPEQLKHLDLDHCYNLASCPLEKIGANVLNRIKDVRKKFRENAISYKQNGIPKNVMKILDENKEIEIEKEKGKEKEKEMPMDNVPFDYIESIKLLVNLESLSLVKCDSLNSKIIELLCSHAHSLTQLNLHSCMWVTSVDMVYIRNMISLRRLCLANCKQLGNDAALILCYVNSSTVRRVRNNQNLVRSCLEGNPDIKSEAEDVCFSFFYYFSPDIRVDVYHAFQNFSLFLDSDLDKIIHDGFLPLLYLDMSYCSFEGIDMRLFSNLLTLDTLILNGCSLFQDHYNIDQVFARQYSSKKTEAELVNEFEESNYFHNQFFGDWKTHQLNVRHLSINMCRLYAKKERCDGNEQSFVMCNQESKRIAASEEERVEVTNAFKLLCLKHMPYVEKLECQKLLLLDKFSLSYAVFWMPHINMLDLRNCSNIDDEAITKFTRMVHNSARNSEIHTLFLDKCVKIGQSSMDAIFKSMGKSLTKLSVHGCTELNDRAFEKISLCTNLQDLDVSKCMKLGKKFLSIISLDDCPLRKTLARLNLGDLNFKSSQVTETLSNCTGLKFITFDRCKFVDNATVVVLHAKLPNLTGMSLRETPKITKEMIIYLTQHPTKSIIVVE